jgi:hypothetical protein
VPVQGARLLAEQLRSRSTEPVVYADLPGGQHSFDLFQSIRFENVPDGIDAFIAWVISRPGQQTSSARQVSLPGLTCSPTPHVTAGRLSGTCMYAFGIGASHLLPVSSTSSTQTVRCAPGNDPNEANFRKQTACAVAELGQLQDHYHQNDNDQNPNNGPDDSSVHFASFDPRADPPLQIRLLKASLCGRRGPGPGRVCSAEPSQDW